MNELFGEEATSQAAAASTKFAVTKPVLKTSMPVLKTSMPVLKTSMRSTTPGSGKSVKFYEEEVKQTETRGQMVANGI